MNAGFGPAASLDHLVGAGRQLATEQRASPDVRTVTTGDIIPFRQAHLAVRYAPGNDMRPLHADTAVG